MQALPQGKQIKHVPTDKLVLTSLPIREAQFDAKEFETLKRSIARDGVQVPIIVRPLMREGKPVPEYWEVCDGCQRTTAAKETNTPTVPAVVLDEGTSDDEVRMLQLVLNRARVPQTKSQERDAIKVFMSHHPEMTQTEVAEFFQYHTSELSNLLGLGRLNSRIMELVDNGSLPVTKAVYLSRLDNEQDQLELLEDAMTLDTEAFKDRADSRKKLRMKERAGIKGATEDIFPPRPRKKEEILARIETLEADSPVCQALKWTLQVDNETLEQRKAEKEARKAQKDSGTLEEQRKKLEAKLKELSQQIANAENKKAAVAGIE